MRLNHAFARLLPGRSGEVHDADPVNGEVVQIHRNHLAEVRPTPVVTRSVSVRIRRKDGISSGGESGRAGGEGVLGHLDNDHLHSSRTSLIPTTKRYILESIHRDS